jgi:hypothetical protein
MKDHTHRTMRTRMSEKMREASRGIPLTRKPIDRER